MANSSTRRSQTLAILILAAFSTPSWGDELISFGSDWSYLQPASLEEDPGLTDRDFDTTWFKENYNTTSPIPWDGPSAAPFDRGGISAFNPDSSRFFIREANTFLPDLETPNRLTAYFRRDFTTTEVSSGFSLELLADDGAKVYLDGEEVLSLNCCLTAGAGQPASFEDLALRPGNERAYSSFRILEGETLSAGDHTLAVAVHNRLNRDSDLGFSLRFTEGLVDMVSAGEEWQYFEAFEEPSNGTLDWAQANFDDGEWDSGEEPFGYEESAAGDPNGVFDMVDPATLLDMQDSFANLFIRKSFSVDQIDDLGELTLTMDYDDGFFAYINGQLVFSSEDTHPLGDPTLPIPIDLDAPAAGIGHESSNNSSTLPDQFTVRLADFPGLLNEGGDNVLAIQGINVNLDSSDFLMAKISLFGAPGPGTSEPLGDFDGDGELTTADINDLSAQVRAGGGDVFYDVTGDGVVDDADRTEWVEVLSFTYFGDANLDGEFNTNDLVQVLTAGEYEDTTAGNSDWNEGDWNGDGDFTTADFVTALTSGGYETGPRAAVAAVPEPSTCISLFIGILLTACRSIRRRM